MPAQSVALAVATGSDRSTVHPSPHPGGSAWTEACTLLLAEQHPCLAVMPFARSSSRCLISKASSISTL